MKMDKNESDEDMKGDDHDKMTTTEHKMSSKKRGLIHYNYLRLPEGKCYDGSTYKCTDHKDNLGGSEWCIMPFPIAIAHCDSDPTCAGYAMNTATSFHKKYDRNGEVAVHLVKTSAKTVPCTSSEWSGYEKLSTVRSTPVVYGESSCDVEESSLCTKSKMVDYVYVSKSKIEGDSGIYLCKGNTKNLDTKDLSCILPLVDAVNVCNMDEKCDGFMISTEGTWDKEYMRNGMQAVQLFGKGVKFMLNDKYRCFQKRV